MFSCERISRPGIIWPLKFEYIASLFDLEFLFKSLMSYGSHLLMRELQVGIPPAESPSEVSWCAAFPLPCCNRKSEARLIRKLASLLRTALCNYFMDGFISEIFPVVSLFGRWTCWNKPLIWVESVHFPSLSFDAFEISPPSDFVSSWVFFFLLF